MSSILGISSLMASDFALLRLDDHSNNMLGSTRARRFDFTMIFEQSKLSIILSALFLLVAPLRLFYLSRSRAVTVHHRAFAFKTVAAICNTALQLSLVITWSSSPATPTRTSVASAALSFVSSVMVLCLSYLEARRSVKPSSLLIVYLLFSIVLDATQVRTLWPVHDTAFVFIQSASLGAKVVMLCLEESSKMSYLKQPYKNYPPEATSGILNQSFVWWLNKLFVTGYRRLISDHDLFDIDPVLESSIIGERLQSAWDKRAKPESKLELPKTVIYFLKWDLLSTVFPRLCMVGFTFAQPFLISAVIRYVGDPAAKENSNHAYSLIGATFLIYFGIAMSTVHYKQQFSRMETTFRGAMISLLYHRTLTLQDGIVAESAVLTLMSTDVDRIINNLENINDIWSRSLEIGIGIWLLARQLGAICVVPLVWALFCTFGQAQVAKTLGKNQQEWTKAGQKRVKNTSSMLSSMKAIKISGLATNIASELQNEREQELKTSRPFFQGIVVLNTLSNFPALWSPVIAFTIFAIQAKIRGTDPLTTVQAFTSLSIITLVTQPAGRLLSLLPRLAAAQGCFERLQAYLLSQSRDDARLEVETPAVNTLLSFDPDEDKGPGEFEHSDTCSKRPNSPIAVAFENATILPAPNATTAAVTNASFTVQTGSLTVLVGPVGSGKTVLLKAILGELPCSSGSVSVLSKDMSYCKQTSWILNISVKEGICGSQDLEVDEEWYSTVVHACALEEDMRQWPQGDQTIVGSKGLTLSGGQKQRVSLARAVYARKKIVLLDDVQSALDTRTQEVINTRLLSRDGLLRRLGSTVILATHSVGCLQLADKIIVLDSEGRVIRETSNKEEFTDPATIKAVEAADNQDQKDKHHHGRQTADPGSDKLMDLTRRSGDMSIYSYYFRTIGFPLLTVYFVAQILEVFVMHFPQILIKWWTDANGEQLPKFLSIYAAVTLANTPLFAYTIWIMFIDIMPRAAVRLHAILLDTVMSAPLSFFTSTDTGITLNRFSQDMSLVDLPLPSALLVFTMTFLNCVVGLALIASGSTYMAITIPFTLIAIYSIQNVYLKTSRQLRYFDIENKSPLYSHFLETLDGLVTIRAFGWQQTAGETHDRHLDHSQKAYYMLLCAQRWLNVVLDLLVAVLAVVVVALAVQLRSSTSAGLIGVALNNVLGFNQALSSVVSSWAQLETSLGAIARVKTFAKTTSREGRPDNEYIPPQEWPEKGAVRLEGVSAVYSETAIALQNISMEITPGQKIGICGRTGSGKSSLILALLHLIETSAGGITIDGIDIRTIPRDILRQRLIAIPQDPFILPGSVRVNADPLGLASDDAIVSALKKINIWTALESRGGLDAIMQDQPLSQGQEQLFCLARAMLRKSKVLILDEATSSVDTETDQIMQKVIREEFGGCTIITVAHRLETITDADRIAVLDAGKLVEFDSPESLLARDSAFRRMRGS